MPVWVVCSESHFSVLMAVDWHPTHNTSPSLPTRLMYYDGLANQEQPIILTLSNSDLKGTLETLQDVDGREEHSSEARKQNDTTLISPLEHVIHTRWPNTSVHWTGSDPIL